MERWKGKRRRPLGLPHRGTLELPGQLVWRLGTSLVTLYVDQWHPHWCLFWFPSEQLSARRAPSQAHSSLRKKMACTLQWCEKTPSRQRVLPCMQRLSPCSHIVRITRVQTLTAQLMTLATKVHQNEDSRATTHNNNQARSNLHLSRESLLVQFTNGISFRFCVVLANRCKERSYSPND